MKNMNDLALFYPEGHENHYEYGHPERPERVETIRKALSDEGLWEEAVLVKPAEIPQAVLQAIHEKSYLGSLQSASEQGHRLDMDTYITKDSWKLALNSASGGIKVAEMVWEREKKRGFALCRPPGHHATPNQAMGFCLLNNIAIAAEYLIRVKGAKKVAIIDIDLHHGNGTQDIFWSRGDVFFSSIHQFPLYPFSGKLEETGNGNGANTTLNIPLPPNSGDDARSHALNEIIIPLLNEFNPEMLLISVGLDAHWRDTLGHQLASADGYGSFISKLTEWADNHCNGRISLFLEGGYDLEAGAASAVAITKALIGEHWEDPLGISAIPEDTRWKHVIQSAKEIWNL